MVYGERRYISVVAAMLANRPCRGARGRALSGPGSPKDEREVGSVRQGSACAGSARVTGDLLPLGRTTRRTPQKSRPSRSPLCPVIAWKKILSLAWRRRNRRLRLPGHKVEAAELLVGADHTLDVLAARPSGSRSATLSTRRLNRMQALAGRGSWCWPRGDSMFYGVARFSDQAGQAGFEWSPM